MERLSDVDVLRCFRWWKHKKQCRYFGMFLLISAAVLSLFTALWYAGLDTFRKTDVVFGFVALLIFEAVALRYFARWLGMFRLEMDQYWFATATGKYKIRTPRRQVKGYRITAKANEKSVDARCVKKSYYKIQAGQRVLLFTTGSDGVHCVHLDVGQ